MLWNKTQVLDYINKLDDDSIIEVTKKQTKTIRSQLQNRYYHGIICKTISGWSWDSTISVHYMIKEMFKLETTTDLSTDEFSFMCKSIIELFKTNYWVVIPTPTDIEDLKNLETYLF